MSNPSRSCSPTPQYSDSFESVESLKKTKSLKRKPVTKPIQINGRGPPGTIRSHPYLSHLKKNSTRNVNANGSDRSYMHTPVHLDESVKRLLSSRSHRINELTSLVGTLKKKIEALQTETKTLKTQTYRQEKALEKIDHAQTEIPSILNHQDADLKMLREQVRRLKEEVAHESEKRREVEARNAKYKQHLLKLKELTEDKSLPERDELQRTVNNLKNEVSEKDKRIVDLEKYIENLQKNYKHERSQEAERFKNAVQSRQVLAQQYNRVQELLREKEKQMDLNNIYSQRMRLRGTMDNSSNVSLNNSEPPSSRQGGGSPHTLTSGRHLERITSNELQRRKFNKVNSQRSHSMQARKTKSVHTKDNDLPPLNSEGAPVSIEHKKADKANGMDEPIHEVEEVASFVAKDPMDDDQTRILRKQAEDEEANARLKLEQQEAERFIREKQLIENLEAEKAERRRREEIERKERERIEDERIREEFAQKERRQKQLKEEEERRLQIEKEKLREATEERKRKDELLKLLAAVDNNVEEAERERQGGISSTVGKNTNSQQSKDYSFSENIENLHRGRPTIDMGGEKHSRMSLDKGALPPIRDSSLIGIRSTSPVNEQLRDSPLPTPKLITDENQNSPFSDHESSFSHSNNQIFTANLRTEGISSQQKSSIKSSKFATQHSDDLEELVL